MSDLHKLIFDVAASVARVATTPKVYPAYIAIRMRNVLRQPDPKLLANEPIVTAASDLETLGSTHYAFTVTDHNGTVYEVAIKVKESAR